jgi:hypothetical protein
MSASRETEPPLQFVNAEAAIMSFPLPHTKGHEATGEMMRLRPRGADLTTTQPEVILTHPDHLLNLRAETRQAAHLRGRPRQAMGGIGPGRRV